eukprot:Plantae.Rhodophyta-Purpureofilum_apyrenoidigerum.ctg452.p1 GENE.Plantae.Rhodophyta-Purpureofilum_apyrenoidigerum.ctg452~~Plantae.Rhodophyta-Purpureofilum_apyrenoidigerum.ctg452.p1  ORF type:complete len:299 (+),score=51.31 Plantae.Rhodophyta-Purpureofilum_apyrenoidigerum.ctg452:70-897(+)
MAAKVVLVTGATDGIGRHTAGNLAKMGYNVLVHGRDPKKVRSTAEQLREHGGSVEEYVADFSSLRDVKRLGEEIALKHSSLDVLINNAGVFEQEKKHSADGYELTWAVNVLAPFTLTVKLLPLLRAASEARIINVASISHQDGGAGRRGGEFDFDNLQHENGYDMYSAYGLSKLAVITFTYEMAERLRDTTITVNTCDPGTVNTKMLLAGWGRCGISTSTANDETFLATAPELKDQSGIYFVGRRKSRSASSTYDKQIRKKLWQELEAMTKVTFE